MNAAEAAVLKTQPESLQAFNAQHAELSASELVRLAVEWFHPDLAFACSFGPEDLVLLHLLLNYEEKPEIFVLDTGRLPAETFDLIELWRLRYDLTIHFFTPEASALQDFVNDHGPNAFYAGTELRKQCCAIRKIEPLRRALRLKRAWLTGLRREQSQGRATVEAFELDSDQRFKISPLVNWTRDQVWAYIRAHDLPYNALHDKGFASIGCAPCSRAIEPGEDERAGRWWWELQSQKECGLHNRPRSEVKNATAPL